MNVSNGPEDKTPKPKGCVVDMMAAPIIWFMVMFVGWTAKARISEWLGIRMGGEAVIFGGVGLYLVLNFIASKWDPDRKTFISKLMIPLKDETAIGLFIVGIGFILGSLLIVFKSVLH